MKKVKKPFKWRMVSYVVAIALVIVANAQAVAEPVSAGVEYVLSRRHEVVVQMGRWDTASMDSPVRSIHAAMLHTGKVLLIAGSGNDEKQFDANTFRSVLWDPELETFKEIPTPWDAFCAGHVFLPDGRLLVAGGTKTYEDLTITPKQEYEGLKDSYIFDPITERYEKVDSLEYARWYPTLVALADGKVLASSGLDEKGEILYGQTEMFDPATKQWTHREDLNQYFPTYPALLLTAEGKLFYTGSNAGYGPTDKGRTPGFWDLTTNSFKTVTGLKDPEYLETSASLLLPPAQEQRVMVMGGGGIGDSPDATNRTAIIDLDETNPTFTDGPKLKEAVRYPSAVILPDDTVLATGGSRGYRTDDVHNAQIFHPDTNTFTDAASPRVGRNYHSEAMLLPDGRVAVFGSNPIDNSFEMRIEIYSPSYLFKGERPQITGGNKKIERGTKTELKTSNPSNIGTAKLMRPSSVTHVTDVEQRSINLPFTTTKDGINVEIPANQNLVPSGWYMAFITDKQGIPSAAYWVHVK
ncbi:MAG TPA: galactose oxidase-like domain-containing protein [Candidatus Saccharimonadales bacterium]|nr:galactose oxidase-like domain-containing protein [Candidatus Saccharimonadales bacterium]